MSNPFFDRPILNSPYELPRRHWELAEVGQPLWADEARAFTPWLAEPDNLRLLGEALGMDLE